MSDYILNWDKALTSIAAWTKLHRDMVKLALGSSILLYGHYFPGTILLVSSLRVRRLYIQNNLPHLRSFPLLLQISGVGAFRKQFQFLSATFSRTLEAIRLSTPELLKLTEQAAALRNELEELNRMQRNGNISLAQYQEGSARLQRDIVAMDQIQRKLSSTVTLLSTAIDPQGLQVLMAF